MKFVFFSLLKLLYFCLILLPSTQGKAINDELAPPSGSSTGDADITFLQPKTTRTAEIVSCSGWALNKLPELKSFLKDGEATSYIGVTVKYVHGRTAVMTIYDEQKNVVEKVDLHVIKSKKRLHDIMKEKGFVRKGDDSKIIKFNTTLDITESLLYAVNGPEIPTGILLLSRLSIVGVCIFIMIRLYKCCKYRQTQKSS